MSNKIEYNQKAHLDLMFGMASFKFINPMDSKDNFTIFVNDIESSKLLIVHYKKYVWKFSIPAFSFASLRNHLRALDKDQLKQKFGRLSHYIFDLSVWCDTILQLAKEDFNERHIINTQYDEILAEVRKINSKEIQSAEGLHMFIGEHCLEIFNWLSEKEDWPPCEYPPKELENFIQNYWKYFINYLNSYDRAISQVS